MSSVMPATIGRIRTRDECDPIARVDRVIITKLLRRRLLPVVSLICDSVELLLSLDHHSTLQLYGKPQPHACIAHRVAPLLAM